MEVIAKDVLAADRAERALEAAVVPDDLVEDRDIDPALQVDVTDDRGDRVDRGGHGDQAEQSRLPPDERAHAALSTANCFPPSRCRIRRARSNPGGALLQRVRDRPLRRHWRWAPRIQVM